MAYPSSSLQIADYITGKPVAEATVLADSTEKTTDSSGMAVLEVPSGKYTVKITHPQYYPKTITVNLPMTEPLTVKLIPLWSIGLGIAAGATLIVAIAAKVAWRR